MVAVNVGESQKPGISQCRAGRRNKREHQYSARKCCVLGGIQGTSPEILGNGRDDTAGRAAADREKSHGWRSAACPQCQWLLVVGAGLAAINIVFNLDIVIIAG